VRCGVTEMFIFDTSAWVEYFIGSSRGAKVRDILESQEKIATPIIVLIELSCKASKEGVDFTSNVDFIRQKSTIIGIGVDDVESVGKTYAKMRKINGKTSLPDAVVATAAKDNGATIVTCDRDFIGVENVNLIS